MSLEIGYSAQDFAAAGLSFSVPPERVKTVYYAFTVFIYHYIFYRK